MMKIMMNNNDSDADKEHYWHNVSTVLHNLLNKDEGTNNLVEFVIPLAPKEEGEEDAPIMSSEKYTLVIKADTNDGDYLEASSIIDALELLKVMSICEKIKTFEPQSCIIDGIEFRHHHNFPLGECMRPDLGEKSPQELYALSDDDLEFFVDLLPDSEYGIHTIESVVATPSRYKLLLL